MGCKNQRAGRPKKRKFHGNRYTLKAQPSKLLCVESEEEYNRQVEEQVADTAATDTDSTLTANEGLESYPSIPTKIASQTKDVNFSHKLTLLRDLGDNLRKTVQQYVEKIIATGESWTEGGNNQIGYPELCQMVDTAVMFLGDKSKELEGETQQVRELLP